MLRILLLIAAVLSAGCSSYAWTPSGERTVGNGKIGYRSIKVSGMPQFEIENVAYLNLLVHIVVGDKESLEIEADENLLPFIQYAEVNGKLKVWTKGKLQSSHPVHVRYFTPGINHLKVRGNTQVSVSGLQKNDFFLDNEGSSRIVLDGVIKSFSLIGNGTGDVSAEMLACDSANISINGSGDIVLGRVNGEYLKISAYGVSNIAIAGQVHSLSAVAAGSGKLSLSGLTARDARVELSGAADAEITATDSIVAVSGGSSRMLISGKPFRRSVKGERIVFL